MKFLMMSILSALTILFANPATADCGLSKRILNEYRGNNKIDYQATAVFINKIQDLRACSNDEIVSAQAYSHLLQIEVRLAIGAEAVARLQTLTQSTSSGPSGRLGAPTF